MRPAPPLMLALLAWAVLGLACAFDWLPMSLWFASGALVLLLAAGDAVALSWVESPTVERDLAKIVPVGVEKEVRLRLRPAGRHNQRLRVHDLLPGDWRVEGLPRTLVLHAGRETSVSYKFVPGERGAFEFAGCQLQLSSALRLWRQRRQVALRQVVRVYPNFAPLARFAMFSAEQASRVVGAHVRRNRGEGTEFSQLREYRVGDSLR